MEISPPRLIWGGHDAIDGKSHGWVRNGFTLPACRGGGSVNDTLVSRFVTGAVTPLSLRAAGAAPRHLFAEVG